MAAKARLPEAVEESICWRSELVLTLHWAWQVSRSDGKHWEDRVYCPTPRVDDTFNYAMAFWGAGRGLPSDFLQKVVELDASHPRDGIDANCEECLALCLGLLGRRDEAQSRLTNARNRIREAPIPTFSCWNYTNVKPPVFEEHLTAIEALIEGKQVLPEFMCSRVKQIRGECHEHMTTRN